MKICKDCKQSKSIEEFHVYNGFTRTDCKVCNRLKCKLNYHRTKRNYKDRQLKNRYGISMDDYEALLKEQNFSCAICETNQSDLTKALAVDHCHKTGKVRGLLCTDCNQALGAFDDNPAIINSAIDYLVTHSMQPNMGERENSFV